MKMMPLYKISVEHDYFSNGQPRQLKFATHRDCVALFRRRGLSLNSSDKSTIEVLFDADGGGLETQNDTILLTLESLDPQFLLYTEWEGINPMAQYRLSLSGDLRIDDASRTFEMVSPSRGVGAKLLEIAIKPTEEMIERAKGGEPLCCTLHFLAPSRYWEYMIVLNNKEAVELYNKLCRSTIVARDRVQKRDIAFSPFEQVVIDGRTALRARSLEKIPLQERYKIDVKVEGESQGGGIKPILMYSMNHPEVGRYQSDDLETLRIIIKH